MKKENQKWMVVTGGAGFIGSGVVRHLNNLGYTRIAIVDNLGTDDKWKNLVGKQFDEMVGIECFFDWMKGREREVEAFIHLGACSSTVEKNADYLLENNFRYSVRLAEIALNHNIRLIYASSAATYGDGSRGFSDDHALLEELEPLNMYGYSKHLFDLWLLRQGALDRAVGLKYFNVFGPNEAHKGRMASAVYHILPQAMNGGAIRLFKSSEPERFGDGEQKRDFLYVKDAARMTCSFLKHDAEGIFNVGAGRAETWNRLAESVFAALQKPSRIEYFEMPEDLRGKYQNYTKAEMGKAEAVLGEDAKARALEDSVADYVQHHLLKDRRW